MDAELKEMVNTYLKDMDNRGDHEARDLLKLISAPAQIRKKKHRRSVCNFICNLWGLWAWLAAKTTATSITSKRRKSRSN